MYYQYINDIVENLKAIKPEKVILFGSYATGDVTDDSDIDLIVVTSDNYFPKNYSEKMEIYLRVSNILNEIMGKVPIDLIVYTKPMYTKFIELGSMFYKEIEQTGKVLYEKSN